MIKNLAQIKGWKRLILIICLILSYAVVKSFNPIAIYSVNGVFLSAIFILGYGVFAWLLFEILIGFFYSGIKNKIEPFISMNEFRNLFRLTMIMLNLATFVLTIIFISINFFAPFMILISTIILSFVAFCLLYKVMVKYYLTPIKGRDLSLTYFSFIFVYLFLMTIMWGSM